MGKNIQKKNLFVDTRYLRNQTNIQQADVSRFPRRGIKGQQLMGQLISISITDLLSSTSRGRLSFLFAVREAWLHAMENKDLLLNILLKLNSLVKIFFT